MKAYHSAVVATVLSTLLYSILSYGEDIPENAQLPLEELRTFTQVFDQIRQAYVEEVDDKTLLENAIIGMLTELDPHSTYLDRGDYQELQEHSTGEFAGLGIEVGIEDGMIRVISPIDDTPAARAGIQSGDLIIKLDEQIVQGMNLQEAVDIMRGPKGSSIMLTLLRHGKDKPVQVKIERDIIKIKSVRSRLLAPDYGYVRIAQFQENTGAQFTTALQTLMEENSSLKGVVLDLRNNPGGLLGSSVEVADALLEEGVIVSTKGRVSSANTSISSTPGDLLNGLPVVAIINEGSASAAEIVAGALQDHQRALIIGTDSFGKGSVQSVLPISEDRAIKLTTARYFTPSGRSIQAEGIKPDIEALNAELRIINGAHIKEKNLSGHLTNGDQAKKPAAKSPEPINDHQLYEALNLLKAASLISREPPKNGN